MLLAVGWYLHEPIDDTWQRFTVSPCTVARSLRVLSSYVSLTLDGALRTEALVKGECGLAIV